MDEEKFKEHRRTTIAMNEYHASGCALSEEQKRKIEENKLRAMELRQAREAARRGTAVAELSKEAGFTRDNEEDEEGEEENAAAQVAEGGAPAAGGSSTSSSSYKFTSSSRPLQNKSNDGCEECNSPLIDTSFQQTFGVNVCATCKSNNEDDYGLMSKGDAVAEYLIQEGTIKVMPYLERSNPRHSKFSSMKLYLGKQVRAKSYERWGGPEALEEERENRKKRKYESALTKTASIFSKKQAK